MSADSLVAWVNQNQKIKLWKINEMGRGDIFCELLEKFIPGSINLRKVKYNAKYEYDFFYNFKLLQIGFEKANINKFFSIEHLIKRRFRDNFELLSWFRIHFQNYSDENFICILFREIAYQPLLPNMSNYYIKNPNCSPGNLVQNSKTKDKVEKNLISNVHPLYCPESCSYWNHQKLPAIKRSESSS